MQFNCKALQTLIYLLRELMKHHYHTFGLLCGGTNRKTEQSKLAQGVNLLVCTPGRLLDHLQQNKVEYCSVKLVVLNMNLNVPIDLSKNVSCYT